MLQAYREDVEGLDLLKPDVLGVRMQSAMAHAVAKIRRTTGRHLDSPDHVDLGDETTFEMIRASDTVGCFQIESPGQQDLVRRLQPRHVQDVVADISLFRPGPVAGGMPARFIAARHSTTSHYPHHDLKPILWDTYGVVIWHEQIIRIFWRMTGCDRAAADIARRALSDPDRLPRVETWLREEAAHRGNVDGGERGVHHRPHPGPDRSPRCMAPLKQPVDHLLAEVQDRGCPSPRRQMVSDSGPVVLGDRLAAVQKVVVHGPGSCGLRAVYQSRREGRPSSSGRRIAAP